MAVRLYNSLIRKVEEFRPINPGHVLLYSCGPTVYYFAQIGNFRTFTLTDFVVRVLEYNGLKVRYIMNLTDVGHLTGDNLGDADTGEDRIEKSAAKEGKSAREIADYYIKQFLNDYHSLNLTNPVKFTRATDYIQEQIELVKELERKGYTYKTADGIYFDTSKFRDYALLSGYTKESVEAGARAEPNKEKRNAADFALWKFSKPEEQRWQEWDSPWGRGFPGWHIECSAMSMKELGRTLDIHLGGEDHKMIHHPNEIAQSEAATGSKFVNYWMHVSFLKVDDQRMGKSLGNAYTVSDIRERGFDPLALRYFYMTAHYRSPQNFTWTGLQSADAALKKLYSLVESYKHEDSAEVDPYWNERFMDSVNDDINLPKALSAVWDMLKSDIPEAVKLNTLLKFDAVLGLNIDQHVGLEIPKQILDLARTRQEYRKAGIWDKADLLRKQIEQLGYTVEDNEGTYKVRRIL